MCGVQVCKLYSVHKADACLNYNINFEVQDERCSVILSTSQAGSFMHTVGHISSIN